jgi:hypothetical protein
LLGFENARNREVVPNLPRHGHLPFSNEEIERALERSGSLIKKSSAALLRCLQERKADQAIGQRHLPLKGQLPEALTGPIEILESVQRLFRQDGELRVNMKRFPEALKRLRRLSEWSKNRLTFRQQILNLNEGDFP